MCVYREGVMLPARLHGGASETGLKPPGQRNPSPAYHGMLPRSSDGMCGNTVACGMITDEVRCERHTEVCVASLRLR